MTDIKKAKILHIGNIANNAYNNAKLLRKKGIHSDVLCYDYFHIMGCPEWEDADFKGDWGDDFNPDWSKINLKNYKRPSWFMQGYLEDIVKNYFPELKTDYNLLVKIERYILRSNTKLLSHLFHKYPPFFKVARDIRNFVKFYKFWVDRQLHPDRVQIDKNKIKYFQALINDFKKYFPNRKDQLTLYDFIPFYNRIDTFKKLFSKYDIIQGYSTDAIWPMLANTPYIAYEHGTLREIPFENSATGRLTALAYKKADYVMITNPDVISSVKKLRIKNYLFVPHCIDWKFTPKKSIIRRALRNKYDVDWIVFVPARQNWRLKKNDWIIKGFFLFLKTCPKAKLILPLWGQDVARTKSLVSKLEIEAKVIFFDKALPKHQFARYYQASDVIIDQFFVGIGGIVPEAISSGKPVIMGLKAENHRWAFPLPPVVMANNIEEIKLSLDKLYKNKRYYQNISRKGLDWAKTNYYWPITLKRHLEIYKKTLNKNT